MNKSIPAIALASLLLMAAVWIISAQRNDTNTETADFSQSSEKREHHDSFHGAAETSGLENVHSDSPRHLRDSNAGSSKSNHSAAYRGPNKIDHWTLKPGASWEQEGNAFISRSAGSIAQDILLTDECSIAFTLEHTGELLDLRLMIFSNDLESQRPSSGYELSFQRNSIYFRCGKTRAFLGSDHSRELSRHKENHIEIRASRTTGTIALLINGKAIEVFKDPRLHQGEYGSGLHFVTRSPQIMSISQIEVDSWDARNDEMLILEEHLRND